MTPEYIGREKSRVLMNIHTSRTSQWSCISSHRLSLQLLGSSIFTAILHWSCDLISWTPEESMQKCMHSDPRSKWKLVPSVLWSVKRWVNKWPVVIPSHSGTFQQSLWI